MRERWLATLSDSDADATGERFSALVDAFRCGDRALQESAEQELRALADSGQVDALYKLWLATRHPRLTAMLAEGGWIPDFAVHLRVIRALEAGNIDEVLSDGSAAIDPIVEAADGPDEAMRSQARYCLTRISDPDAVDALVTRWARDRSEHLRSIVVERCLVARQPPDARVLSALVTGRVEELTGEAADAIRPLVRALSDTDPYVHERARWVLLRLTNQHAIDELTEVWAHDRAPELGAIISEAGYVATKPRWVRVLSALMSGRIDSVIKNPSGLIAPLVQAADDRDPAIAARARQTLDRVLDQGQYAEELCAVVLEQGSALAERLAMERGLIPTDTRAVALFWFLTGQWQEYETLDFDMSLLREAYEHGGKELRDRIARRARQAGRLELVELVAGVRHKRRMGRMTIREWEVTLGILDDRRDWETMWRLAQSAPAVWSVRALRRLDTLGWAPEEPASKVGFARLLDLANRCRGEAPILGVADRPSARFKAHGRRVTALVISSYFENTLASASWDGTVRTWRMPDGQALTTISAHRHPITSIAATADGSILATGCGAERNVILWALPEGRLMRALPDHALGVASLAMSPDGTLLAAGCFSGLCHIWRVSDGALLHTLRGHRDSVRCVAFSPDASLLATGGEDTTIRLWSVRDGRYLATLPGHRMTVRSVAFTPDGQILASGGFDDDVILWSVPDRCRLATLKGHTQAVYSLAVSGDGRILASGSWDGTVGLWVLPDGRPGGVLEQHDRPVTCLATDPESRVLVSGSHDSEITLWNFQSGIFRRPTTREDMERVEDLLGGTVDPGERTWLEFLIGQMQWRFRFDIEIEKNPARIEVGEFDIEIEG